MGRGSHVTLLHSDIYRQRVTGSGTDRRKDMTVASHLCKEVMPQNVVQVGSVLRDLG